MHQEYLFNIRQADKGDGFSKSTKTKELSDNPEVPHLDVKTKLEHVR